jgi:hypothetical protein
MHIVPVIASVIKLSMAILQVQRKVERSVASPGREWKGFPSPFFEKLRIFVQFFKSFREFSSMFGASDSSFYLSAASGSKATFSPNF